MERPAVLAAKPTLTDAEATLFEKMAAKDLADVDGKSEHPLLALALALVPPASQPPMAAELAAQRELVQFLRTPNGRGEFDGLLHFAANQPGVDTSPLVVLVDQLEEVYTLCSDATERDAFVGVLLHAAVEVAAGAEAVQQPGAEAAEVAVQ